MNFVDAIVNKRISIPDSFNLPETSKSQLRYKINNIKNSSLLIPNQLKKYGEVKNLSEIYNFH